MSYKKIGSSKSIAQVLSSLSFIQSVKYLGLNQDGQVSLHGPS